MRKFLKILDVCNELLLAGYLLLRLVFHVEMNRTFQLVIITLCISLYVLIRIYFFYDKRRK